MVEGDLVDGEVILYVSDTGIGISEEFDVEDPQTTGFRLIHLMVKQLSGTLSVDQRNGTKFKIVFPHQISSQANRPLKDLS